MAGITDVIDLSIDQFKGKRLSNSSDTILLLDLVPYTGIVSFQEPEITFEQEKVYSNFYSSPIGVIEKSFNIGDGSISILESSYAIFKSLYKITHPTTFSALFDITTDMVGKPFIIVKAVFPTTDFIRSDLKQLRIYLDVIPISEGRPIIDHSLNAYVVDIGLMFTKRPITIDLLF